MGRRHLRKLDLAGCNAGQNWCRPHFSPLPPPPAPTRVYLLRPGSTVGRVRAGPQPGPGTAGQHRQARPCLMAAEVAPSRAGGGTRPPVPTDRGSSGRRGAPAAREELVALLPAAGSLEVLGLSRNGIDSAAVSPCGPLPPPAPLPEDTRATTPALPHGSKHRHSSSRARRMPPPPRPCALRGAGGRWPRRRLGGRCDPRRPQVSIAPCPPLRRQRRARVTLPLAGRTARTGAARTRRKQRRRRGACAAAVADGGAGQAGPLWAVLGRLGRLEHLDLGFNKLLAPPALAPLGGPDAGVGGGGLCGSLRSLVLASNAGFQSAGPALLRCSAPPPGRIPVPFPQ